MGIIPEEIILRTNTGCHWRVRLRDVDGNLSIDKGWAGFAIAHDLQIGYLLTFKIMTEVSFRVVVFDLSNVEMVLKCDEHDPTLAVIKDT